MLRIFTHADRISLMYNVWGEKESLNHPPIPSSTCNQLLCVHTIIMGAIACPKLKLWVQI